MRYAMFADLAGRDVLMVGAGAVAERKIAALISAGARVTVTAPEASLQIRQWASDGCLRWVSRAFRPEDLDGAWLAFAATDDAGVNRAVVAEAKARRVWVNAADDPAGGDFHVPATHRAGEVTVAVATEGGSPALAAWLRDRVETSLDGDVARLAALCRALRAGAQGEGQERPAERFRLFFASEGPDAVLAGDESTARKRVDAIFGAGAYHGAVKRMTEE